MANVNLFASAKTVAKKPAAGKAEVKPTLIEGFEDLAIVEDMIAALTAIKSLYKTPVTDIAKEIFANQAFETKKKPENFKAIEGDAKGSIQCRKRSSASGMNDTQIELLKKYGISYETVGDMPDTYIFNANEETQKWINDNQEKISKALTSIKGCPENVLQKQDATTKVITTAESVNEMAKLPIAAIREVFDVVCTIAVSAHLETEAGEEMSPKDIVKKLNKIFKEAE